MPGTPRYQRIKERKLVQWALAYLAGAWVVYEAASTVGGHFGLSDLVFQGLFVILAVGLVVTIVLAWYHGERGRQRISGPELLIIALLLLIAGTGISSLGQEGALLSPPQTGAPLLADDDRPALAVMPCENFSPDPDDAYFAKGIHEEVLLRLAKIAALRSVGRESVEWYRENPRPIREMALELGVGFVGECSVRKDVAENQVRVTFQLIDAGTGSQLWAENYDEDLNTRGIFEIHGDVALRVARALEAELTPEERVAVTRVPTPRMCGTD